MALFPPRSQGREPLLSSYWSKRWPSFIIPAAMVGIILQLLFLGNMSYLYGTVFKSSGRAHALKIISVDFDGGHIGTALSQAYESLKGNDFPTIEFHDASDYPTPELLEEAVCKEDYWAAIYTHSGASDHLMATINGTNSTAYNPASTITYSYIGSYYPVIASSMIEGNMQTLVAIAAKAYYGVAIDAFAAVNLTNPASASAFVNPIVASSDVHMPTLQGTRVLLNTVSMVMPILMQFFFLMGMNGIFGQAGVFSKLSKRDTYLVRLVISQIYSLLGSLCMTGYIWAYREDWSVDGAQFGQTWMCLWLFMQINYAIIDTVIETIIPMKFFSFFFLTWIVINVASTIYPFPLSPGFYRWGYALPAHNILTLLMEIWSGGCKLHNEVALPVLLVWFVFAHITSAWSVYKRCVAAEGVPMQERMDTEVTLSSDRDTASAGNEENTKQEATV